ncbi:hypothetical protein [Myxosarcina sp. GI1]|uniref:hypothetical protein n=1 Tax=Myxosarcina sp. GI1 TaxID=1541065 RepID=UPI00055F23D0|nr:hypothetical protein [Myxosarcina sp. GI1]
MQYKQWLWKSSFAALVGIAFTNPVAAQTNQSDTSGHQTYNAPFVTIGSGGTSASALSRIRRRAYNPATGQISFGFEGFTGEFSIDPRVISRFDSSISKGCVGESCQQASLGETQEITLNEIAELLELDLDSSIEQLARAEDEVQKAALEPRRIVRRSSQDACVNPYIKASQEVESKLEQSKKFIEQVDPIEPQNELW